MAFERVVAAAIGKYMVRGPYTPVDSNIWSRSVTRALVDWTTCSVGGKFYPLDSLTTRKPTRAVNNGHAISGAVRDAARRLINDYVFSLGLETNEISPARQSSAASRRHQHYAPGDLSLSIKNDRPKPGQVTVCIDTDYYLESLEKTFGYPNPAILHTFSPTSVAGLDGDSRYRIINDEIVYSVGGGGEWRHKIWNWDAAGEFIAFRNQLPSHRWSTYLARLFGLENMIVFKIAHARPWTDCPGRLLVWLMPVFIYWRFTFWQTDMHVRTIKRRRFGSKLRPGWNQIVSPDPNDVRDLRISFGRAGEDAAATIRKPDFDILMGLGSAQSVTSRMLGLGYKDVDVLALTGQYYSAKDQPPTPRERITATCRGAQPDVHWPASTQLDAPIVSARAYSPPVLENCSLVPNRKSPEALLQSLEKRVTYQRNLTVPTPAYSRYAREFVEALIPVPHKGVPYCLEETVTMLSKPTQVAGIRRIWDTVDMEPRALIEAFIKNEPCMKNPRIISSFPDMRYLLKFSRFTLKFRDVVLHNSTNQWFHPGKSPAQIADAVQEFAANFNPVETDFSNMDGTVSEWLQRHVMNAVYHRYFALDYSKELTAYTEMLINCPARAKNFGFRYEAGVGVKSGSPTTCDLNTVLNAFVEFCALRRLYPESDPSSLMTIIGPKFGDDGLAEAYSGQAMLKVSRDLGLSLKVVPFDPEKGLTYLARVFPDPTRTTTSFQDPLRTWRKLHLTMRDPNVPLATAAYDRMKGYLVSDALSPLVGDYARAVIRRYEGEYLTDARRLLRKCRVAEKPYWLTNGGAWPQDPVDVGLMKACACARVGIDPAAVDLMCEGLQLKGLDSLQTRAADFAEADPTEGTLDRDSQPLSEPIEDERLSKADPIEFMNGIKDTVSDRERVPSKTRGARGPSRGSHRRPRRSPEPDRSQRPGSFPKPPGNSGEARGASSRITPRETSGRRLAEGRGTTHPRPRSPDRSATRRDGGTRHRDVKPQNTRGPPKHSGQSKCVNEKTH
nr:MAG: RNA-dependent RNA polymerase [Henan forest noda-like virus 1]